MMPKCVSGYCPDRKRGCFPAKCPRCGEQWCDVKTPICPGCGYDSDEEMEDDDEEEE